MSTALSALAGNTSASSIAESRNNRTGPSIFSNSGTQESVERIVVGARKANKSQDFCKLWIFGYEL
jgi:hypothetical protein